MTLAATSEEPLGVGSVIKRHITRLGRVVDGEMTVTEFDRDRAFAVEIHDGPATMFGRTTFADLGGDRTKIDVNVDAPDCTRGGTPRGLAHAMFNCIECFNTPVRHHSMVGYPSPRPASCACDLAMHDRA